MYLSILQFALLTELWFTDEIAMDDEHQGDIPLIINDKGEVLATVRNVDMWVKRYGDNGHASLYRSDEEGDGEQEDSDNVEDENEDEDEVGREKPKPTRAVPVQTAAPHPARQVKQHPVPKVRSRQLVEALKRKPPPIPVAAVQSRSTLLPVHQTAEATNRKPPPNAPAAVHLQVLPPDHRALKFLNHKPPTIPVAAVPPTLPVHQPPLPHRQSQGQKKLGASKKKVTMATGTGAGLKKCGLEDDAHRKKSKKQCTDRGNGEDYLDGLMKRKFVF